MRDSTSKKALAALVIFFAACPGSENQLSAPHAAAFAPPARRERAALSAETHRHQRRRGHRPPLGVALRVVSTKSPRQLAGDLTSDAHRPDELAKPRVKFDLLPDFMQKDPLLVTKQKWMEKSTIAVSDEDESPSSERRKGEMMAMSAVSLVLAVGVVYALASSTPEMIESSKGALNEPEGVVRDLLREGNVERMEIATRNIVGTVLPQSAEDVIAVSIGEGIAGVIGAFATWLLGIVLNFKSDENFILTPVSEGMEMLGEESTRRYLDSQGISRQSNVDALVSEAVADGDYFLTRAAAQPLLEAFGIPIFVASFASVLIATLPYEAVKLTSQKRMNDMKEEMLLAMLQEEEETRSRDMNVIDRVSNRAFEFIQQLYVRPTSDDDDDFDFEEPDESEDQLKQQLENVPALDYIELFADLTKWLEYDVLISNYRGILMLPNGQMIGAGWESAIFGLLSALSSQLYTDVLYLYSDFGNPMKRQQTIDRTLEGWASVYATKCLSAATLFGVYEVARAPTSRFVSQLVSGGVAGCAGSSDFDLCMETYLVDNPPAATFEADFRAFAVSAMNWADNFSWLLPLNDQETFASFARGTFVSLYSILARVFNG